MPAYIQNGSAVNFRLVTHCWITDNEICFYFIGGTSAIYMGRLAEDMWRDYKRWMLRKDN